MTGVAEGGTVRRVCGRLRLFCTCPPQKFSDFTFEELMKKITSLALLFGAVSSQTQANPSLSQDEQLKLPGVVVTASREAESIEGTSAAVTVFTREDIDRLQPLTVEDLLRQVPGVHIAANGGRGSTVGLYIRGTSTAQSLVLIDGQRAASASSGATAINALSPDQIERIEVLRGPRSAIYGADAIGGVIQIFTRRGDGEGLNPRVQVGYGSQETWKRSVGLSGGNQDTRFSLNVSSDETNGIDRTTANTGPSADKDAYRNNSVSAHLSHRFSENLEAGASVLHQEGETEYDNTYSLVDYPYDEFKLTNLSTYVEARPTASWRTRFELGRNDNDNINLKDNDPAFRNHYITTRHSAAWLNSVQLTDAQGLRVGLDWYEEKLDAKPAMAEDSRWNRGAYLQHRFQSDWLATEVGVRHDDNEAYGEATTLSSAVTLPINETHSLTLSYSEAFRAPTFNDLYSPWGNNPDLNPEESKNVELLWRSRLSNGLHLETSIYRNAVDDLIVWSTNSLGQDMPLNVDRALLEGLEASLSYRTMAWTAQAGISLLRAKDRDTDEDLIRRPRQSLHLGLDHHFGNFSLGGTVLGVGKAYDTNFDTWPATRVRLGGYTLLNLRANWNVTPEVSLAFKVDNVFDKDYTSVYSYQEDGRTALVSVTWAPVL